MWKSINASHQRQREGTITEVDINVNYHWTRKYKQSEVGLGIMETKIKRFLLTKETQLMGVRLINKDLGTLLDTTSEEKLLSG